MGEYKKIESVVLRLDNEGDYIEGTLVSKEAGDFNNKKYKIKKEDGSLVTLFGTTMLDDLMSTVKIDQQIKIVNTGEKESKKKGQNPMRLFDVYVK